MKKSGRILTSTLGLVGLLVFGGCRLDLEQEKKAFVPPQVTELGAANGQFLLSGTGFKGVKSATIRGNGSNTPLRIFLSTDESMFLLPSSTTKLIFGSNYDLVLANPNGSFSLPVQFQVTGSLPVPNGGTGLTTLPVNSVLIGNGTGALEAVASTAAGQVLVNQGSALSPKFGTLRGSGPVSLDLTTGLVGLGVVPVSLGGTGIATAPKNQILLGNGSGAFKSLSAGTPGQILMGQGSGNAPSFVSISADAPLSFDFQTLSLKVDRTVTLLKGGTGNTRFKSMEVLVGKGSNPISTTRLGTAGQILVSEGSSLTPLFRNLTGKTPLSFDTSTQQMKFASAVPISSGGTGVASLSANALLVGNDSSAWLSVASTVNGQLLMSNGSGFAPSFTTVGATSPLTFSAASLTLGLPITRASVDMGGTGVGSVTPLGVLVGSGGTSALQFTAAGTAQGQLLFATAGLPAFGALTTDSTLNLDPLTFTLSLKPLTVSQGGTGKTSLPLNSLLFGNGTSPVGTVAPTGAGEILVSQGPGSSPIFRTFTASSPLSFNSSNTTVSLGIVSVLGGGLGASSLTSHGLLVGNGTTSVLAIAPGATGEVLTSNGASLPSFQSSPSSVWSSSTQSGTSCTIGVGQSYTVFLANGGATCALDSSFPKGFQVQIRKNDSTKTPVTVNLTSSGGVTTPVSLKYLNNWVWALYDGSQWRILSQNQRASSYTHLSIFTSSGSFTVPTGVTQLSIALSGGGGGGAKCVSDCSVSVSIGGGGGGGGGYSEKVATVAAGTLYTVTVGSGGDPGVAGGKSELVTGGVTLVSALGGGTGSCTTGAAGGSGAGAGSGVDLSFIGGNGGDGILTGAFGGGGGAGGGQSGPGFSGFDSSVMNGGAGGGTSGGLSGSAAGLAGTSAAGLSVISHEGGAGGGGAQSDVSLDGGNGGFPSGGGGGGVVDCSTGFHGFAGLGAGGYVLIQY